MTLRVWGFWAAPGGGLGPAELVGAEGPVEGVEVVVAGGVVGVEGGCFFFFRFE